jgi:hypothetical protein
LADSAAATDEAFASSMSASISRAPSLAKRSAHAAPIPCPAPVINATRDCNLVTGYSFRYAVSVLPQLIASCRAIAGPRAIRKNNEFHCTNPRARNCSAISHCYSMT